MDFRVADMNRTAGRPLCSALRPAALRANASSHCPAASGSPRSWKTAASTQNEVSERLSEQVKHALYELLRGLQAAHDASGAELLREPLSPEGDRNDIYRGLLSVILRLVFLLYARSAACCRRTRPSSGTTRSPVSTSACAKTPRSTRTPWTSASVPGRSCSCCFASSTTERATTAPAARSACRSAGRAVRPGPLPVPRRPPCRYGRGRPAEDGARPAAAHLRRRRVPGAGEAARPRRRTHLSYRTLDVEQIGSVYETIMGFRMEIATGRSVAIKPAKKLGAPSTVDLDALLAQGTGNRAKWLQPHTDRNLTDTVAKGLRAAETVEDLHAALDRVLDKDATPGPRAGRRPRAATERGAPPIGLPLHPPRADRAHRAPYPGARPRTAARRGRPGADPGANSRHQGLRPGHGLRRLPGRDLPPACRRAHRCVGRPRRDAGHSARRGRGDPCSAPRRSEVPVRSRPEPDGGGPRQGLAVAEHAGERSSADLRGPCVSARGFAGGAVAATDRGVPLAPGRAASSEGHRGWMGT